MSNESTSSSSSTNHGLPPRQPPSIALWTHLLRKDTTASTAVQSAPPITPLDKNGTTMRVLLHDTQANFEKFSARVDTLIGGINDAKLEIKLVKKLFEQEREALTGDFVDLVNRCQTEIQKSVGSPSQASQLERVYKDVDHRVEGINQRLDAIQMFNQTHSQALQTQVQALQTLQDQQGTIIAAVLPLLPLLQALPLHIETSKSSLNEHIQKLSALLTSTNNSSLSSAAAPITTSLQSRKRSQSALLGHSSPNGTNKRARINTVNRSPLFGGADTTLTSFIAASTPRTSKLNAPIRSSHHSHSTSRSSKLANSAINNPTSLSFQNQPNATDGCVQNATNSIATFVTPNRPSSGGICMSVPCNNTSRPPSRVQVLQDIYPNAPTSSSRLSSPFSSGITMSTSRPPHMHSSASMVSTIATSKPATLDEQGESMCSVENDQNQPGTTDDRLSNSSPKHRLAAQSIPLSSISPVTGADSQGLSLPLGPAPSGSVRTSTPVSTINHAVGLSTGVQRKQQLIPASSMRAPNPVAVQKDQVAQLPFVARLKLRSASTAVPVTKVRARRSPFRQGRRFIPLIDSEDEEDENDEEN